MSALRALKRRKLDHAASASSPARHSTNINEHERQSPQTSPATREEDMRELSGTEKWNLAKSVSRTFKNRDRRSLDPLRNQKSQESLTPQKKREGNKIGFFKQFVTKETLRSPRKTEEIADSEIEEIAPDRSTERGTGAMKGYVYAKPKKTFEDEIKELEENARKKAADDESEDELALGKDANRSSTRKVAQRKVTHEPKVVASMGAAMPKPLDRRKAKKVDYTLAGTKQRSQGKQEEEFHESEVEQVEAADELQDHSVQRNGKLSTPKKAAASLPNTNIEIDSANLDPKHLRLIQNVLLEKVTGKRPITLVNLDDEFTKVNSVVNQTVTAGESNSIMLIGARGSGKSALVNQVLQQHALKHPNDFHTVRLNGFIHTDDKVALREIWRQLGREMDVDEDESVSKNYADTMSKLLALLSHPAEMGMGKPDQVTKSVVFVLDEFDLFATHPRQTLLYNLFDIAQSRKAPIAVLGLTTRIDVAESLEKRVKSRFSHRYVHLSLSKSFQAYESICRKAMELMSTELSNDELAGLGATTKVQEALDAPKNGVPIVLVRWNRIVETFFQTEAVSGFLRRVYHTTKSVPDFFVTLTSALATMKISSTATMNPVLDHLTSSFHHPSLQSPDSKLSLLASLSTLQLALVICAARLTNIYNTEVMSFSLAYEEYKVLASKAKLQASAVGALAQGRIWGKAVARDAWEELMDIGLVIGDGRTGRVDVGLEEIGMSGVDLGAWGKWCREI